MRALWVALIMASVALAGCSEEAKKNVDCIEGCGPVVDPDEVEKDKGVIRGVVVDETISPIAQAAITIKTLELETTTDANGGFVFVNLEPGVYFMDIEKPGYNAVQSPAEVVAGVVEPDIIKVILQSDPESLPFVLPHFYTGHIGCSYKVANFVGGCNRDNMFGEEDSTIFLPLDRRPTYYQNEIYWESTQTLGGEMVTIQWACAEGGGCNPDSTDHRTCNVRGASPIVCRVHGDEGGGSESYKGINGTRLGEEDRGLYVRAYANCYQCVLNRGVGVMIQQDFDSYTHVFYNFKPSEEWQFTSDGAPDP